MYTHTVFTRCKDSLQNGRRLENLSWRLLFVSGGRRDNRSSSYDLTEKRAEEIKEQAADAGLSDAEWEETSDSSSDEEEQAQERGRRPPASAPSSTSPPKVVRPRGRTASVPADPSAATKETAQRPPFCRDSSREWKAAPAITGNSLQRMFAELQRLPEIPAPGKARSVYEASIPSKPPLGSRGSSAPDGLSQASLSRPATPPAVAVARAATVDALTQTTPNRSRRASPVRSPCMSRSASTPSHPTTSASTITITAPTPAPSAPSSASSSRRVPSKLTMSAMPPTPTRRSRPSSPSPPSLPPGLRLTPTETAMMALSNSRVQSDANLTRRSQSTAELAASFKPASYIKGFNPSPSSFESHPSMGSIAPPPTPATKPAALAPSPPLSKTPASSPASLLPSSALRNGTPAKVPPPRPLAANPTPGPSKVPARERKIFFISSPDSDEDHSSRSRDSKRVVVTPPTASKVLVQQKSAPALSARAKGKAVVQIEDDDDAWGSEDDEEEGQGEEQDDDDDASSGWGSEYSTDTDVARNSARSAPPRTARPGLDFTKRAPSDLARTASTVSIGQPGELKPRPPGLLSQLFHPDQWVDDSDRSQSSTDVMRRNHKSLSALSSLSQLRPSKSAAVLNGPRPSLLQQSSTRYLRPKPEDVELESSSDDDSEAEEGVRRKGKQQGENGAAIASGQSSDYEDVDDTASSSAESAAALLARRQRLAAEIEAQAAVLAPPQTPRTTRRAMLATELSESLRRNLLWERQTRNKVMGGAAPRRPVGPGQPLPQRPASSIGVVPPHHQHSATTTTSSSAAPPAPAPPIPHVAGSNNGGLRPPNPTPSTRHSPPIHTHAHAAAPPPKRSASFANLPRRHTTGTGLYLAAQSGKWPLARGEASDSELSESDEEEEEEVLTMGGGGEKGKRQVDLFGGAGSGQRVW